MSEACISQMQSDQEAVRGFQFDPVLPRAQFPFGGSVPSPYHEAAVVQGTRKKGDWSFWGWDINVVYTYPEVAWFLVLPGFSRAEKRGRGRDKGQQKYRGPACTSNQCSQIPRFNIEKTPHSDSYSNSL
jgi:hypothetical protein